MKEKIHNYVRRGNDRRGTEQCATGVPEEQVHSGKCRRESFWGMLVDGDERDGGNNDDESKGLPVGGIHGNKP